MPRLITRDGKQLKDCSYIQEGYLLEDPIFPHHGNPLNVIANVALLNNQAENELVAEGSMEIDYIKVYQRIDPCENFEDFVRVEENDTWTTDRRIRVLRIEEDVTLNLDNCTIQFQENERIYLDEGAKLIMNGATLTSCSPDVKWDGIKADDNAFIDMNSWSRIENATIGARLGSTPMGSPSGQIVFDDTPTIEMGSYSGFKNCEVGIQLGVGHTKSRLTGRSWFEGCGTAILTNQSSGLVLDRVEFYNNLEHIRAIDSYIHVRDGNAFHGGETGVSIEGTFPGSTGIDIGDMGQGWNFFASNMENGIICQGAEHPVGANIVNCRFSNVTNLATGFGGSNQYMYYNNTVENAPNGVFSFASGDNLNMTRCNEFSNISNVDNLYLFDNQNTQFLENASIGSHNVNYGFLSSIMPNDIGSKGNPAGNCFSDNGEDIVTGSLFIFGQGNNFKYHFYDGIDADPCQEPLNSGNYSKEESDVEPNHCDGAIGIFNLIDPDGDGVNGVVPDTDNPPTCTYHIPKDSVKIKILHWISEVVKEGGDDPRTPINEETSPPTPIRNEYEAILDQWIRYAIYRGNDEGDCSYVESILSPLVTFHWQKRRYGQRIMCGDIEGALNVLNSLQSEDPDIVAFKKVQNINLKRLRGLGEGNWISEAEISELKTISKSEVPSSGYARSLYRLLTGIKVPYDIPDMDDFKSNVSPRGMLDQNQKSEEMRIFPNPATDKIHLGFDKELSKISILDINGTSIITYNNQSEIDVSELVDGLYIISLHFIDGTIINQKMVIN